MADWLFKDESDVCETMTTIPGDVTTGVFIQVGQSVTETIDFSGDRDWFFANLQDGQTYQVTLVGAAANGQAAVPGGDMIVRLYHEQGELINFDDDGGPGAGGRLTFTAFGNQTFYFEADAPGSAIGGYRLSLDVFNNGADKVVNGIEDNPTVEVGGSVSGVIDYNTDEDWYDVQLVAGQTYGFQLNATGANGLDDPFVARHDANGLLLVIDDDFGMGGDGDDFMDGGEGNDLLFGGAGNDDLRRWQWAGYNLWAATEMTGLSEIAATMYSLREWR